MTNKQDDLRLDKYLGALWGAAVGDALGWPNEQNSKRIGKESTANKELFQKWSRRCGGRFWAHEEEIYPGEYSDDTQMIIATARSLRYGNNWSRHFSKVEIPAWTSYERGGGGATKRAAEVWKKGRMPWKLNANNLSNVKSYFDAGGNGVAMRILPHIFKNEDVIDEVMHQVVLNGIFTHGHPRALLGATLYADALICLSNLSGTLGYGELVSLLIERKDKWGCFPKIRKLEEWLMNANTVLKSRYMDIWDSAVRENIDLLNVAREGLKLGALDTGNDILQKLGCFDKKVNGSGTVTAVASIYLSSKYASNPHIGLTEAAHLANSDTDTLASMVGGLLGMLHGTEWLSATWHGVQDFEFLRKLIQNVKQENIKETALLNQTEFLDSTDYSFKRKLKEVKCNDTLVAFPFNVLTVLEKKLNKSNVKGISVHTIKLLSEEGQIIFIKIFEKSSKNPSTLIDDKARESSEVIEIDTVSDQLEFSKGMKNNSVNLSDKKSASWTTGTIEEFLNNNTLVNKKQVLINANRLRSFANVSPEEMPIDQYLFLISDIMIEIERVGTGKLDENTLNLLKGRWHKFNIGTYHIEKIIKILMNY